MNRHLIDKLRDAHQSLNCDNYISLNTVKDIAYFQADEFFYQLEVYFKKRS